MTSRLFIQAIRRHRTLFIALLLITAGAGAALWYWLPLPRHTGAVVFHVASQPPTVLAPTSESRVDFHTYRQTQSSLVRKRHVLTEALSRPEIANQSIVRSQTDPVAWLERHLVVDFRSGTEVMRVTLEGNEPNELRAVLAAVSRSYLAEVDEGENGQRRRRLEKLDAARQEQQERLGVVQKQIDIIAVRLGSKDGTSLALQDQMAREELGHATRELNDIEAQVQFLGKPAGKTDETVPVELVNERLRLDPGLALLEADAAKARDRAAEIAALLKPGSTTPALTRARDDAKTAEDRLERATAALRRRIESTIKVERAAAATEKQSATADELKRLTKRQRAVEGQIEDLKARIAATSQARVDLENLKAQMGQIDKLGPSLTEETERLRLELGAPSRVTLTEEPYTLSGIEGNRRLKMTLLGVMGVFLAGYGGLVGWEYRSRASRTSATPPMDSASACLAPSRPPAGTPSIWPGRTTRSEPWPRRSTRREPSCFMVPSTGACVRSS